MALMNPAMPMLQYVPPPQSLHRLLHHFGIPRMPVGKPNTGEWVEQGLLSIVLGFGQLKQAVYWLLAFKGLEKV